MTEYVTHSAFVQRFPALVLDQRTPPRKRAALLTMLVGAMTALEIAKPYGERSLNQRLMAWSQQFSNAMRLDHVTLRRLLVDEGCLLRDRAGATYVLYARTPVFAYDASIRALDLAALVAAEQERRLQRRVATEGHPAH